MQRYRHMREFAVAVSLAGGLLSCRALCAAGGPSAQDQAHVFVQLGHTYDVFSVAFSPDGRYALSGSATLKLWDVSSAREIRTFKGAGAVAFSPDGRQVLSGSDDHTLKLWEVSSGREIRAFKGHAGSVSSVAFSPDGRDALSGSGDHTLKLWDVSSGREIRTLKGHTNYVTSVAFSPDGQYALSGSHDDTLKLWDVASGREIRTLKGHTGSVISVAFSPDGRHALSGSHDHTLKLWEVSSGREIPTFNGHTDLVLSVAFSPDGQYALSGGWDLEPGRREGVVKLWRVASGREIWSLTRPNPSNHPVAFSPEGRHVLWGHDDGLTLLDVSSGREIRTLTGHTATIWSVAVSPDGRHALLGSDDHTLKLWDVSSGGEIRVIKGHTDGVLSLAFSPDGYHALSGGGDHTVKLWEVPSGREIRTLTGHTNSVWSVAFSPDGRRALSSDSEGELKLWDVSLGREIRTIKRHGGYGKAVALSPDGQCALSECGDSKLTLWELSSGREIRAFQGYTEPALSVAFSPDGRYALSGGETMAELREVSSGRRVQTFKWHKRGFISVVFSRDGRQVLSASEDRTVKLWDVTSGREIKTLRGHAGAVLEAVLSPDGKYALSGGADGTARLWDLASGEETCQFISFTDGEWLAFTPEGFFNASPRGGEHLNVRYGNRVYAIDQFHRFLYRPDLVQEKLRGDSDGLVAAAARRMDLAKILTGGAPPTVAIVSPRPGKADRRDVQVDVEITDEGGGIGDVIWTINGTTIGVGDGSQRGLGGITASAASAVMRLSKLISLSPGKNVITVSAYNRKNEISSDPARVEIALADAISTRPALYVLTIGIDRYYWHRNLRLNLCRSDARSLVTALEQKGGSIFTKVVAMQVFDEQATQEGIGAAFKQLSKQVEAHDVFVLYLAGHGVTHDGLYYFLPYDFRYRGDESVVHQGISRDHLMRWLASIKARKCLVLMDTCQSGSFAKVRVAMRGIAEMTAINRLVRATGRATIVASQADQPALEGYKGHGIFTYALLQALAQADAKHGNRDKVTSVREISAYIDDRVPEITFEAFGYRQVPQVNMQGRDFPLAVVP